VKKGDFVWLGVLGIFSALMLLPTTHQIFVDITKVHPFWMGFMKFAVLATMGELVAIRIGTGDWKEPPGLVYRTLVWGLIGMIVVLMFELFGAGVTAAAAKGLLWTGPESTARFVMPFLISTIMNFIFAPTFMIAHRITDTYIELACETGKPFFAIKVQEVIATIDWQSLIGFVVLKTIPFFWIPAHTIVFLLPPEYRVLVAAYLAIALGAILSFGKKKDKTKSDEAAA